MQRRWYLGCVSGLGKERNVSDCARWGTGILAAICLAAPIPLFARVGVDHPAAACATKNLVHSTTVKQYVFATYESDAGACLQVVRAGKVIFRRTLDSQEGFTLGQPADSQGNTPAIAGGTDVTGRGNPDMIVSAFTGGAHCCTFHFVFELQPEFKLLATLDDADDDLSHFERDRQDGHYYYITADWTFAYWPDCFACSPSALVKLRWIDDKNGGGFHLAADKMQKPAPTQKEWNRALSEAQKAVNSHDVNSIGTTMWQTVLNLIYSGHSDLAWKFVDELGPKAQQKPLPTLANFCSLLAKSQFWPDLKPTLKDTPAACANAGPGPSQ
jgi:hypothetical protein